MTERSTVGASAPALGIILSVVVLGHLTLFPKIADLDGFYHIGHATVYLLGSALDTSFPWATQSVIAERGADLWWGFHVVLMPFASIGDVEWSIRLAGLALTLVLAGSFYWVLRRHGVTGAGWWTVAFLLAVPNVSFRHLMLRPHVLSLAASLGLLSVLVRGRWWQALVLSATITWLHLGVFWMGPGIVVAYALVRALERAWGAREAHGGVDPASAMAVVFLGTTLGWLCRPHPVQAASVAGIQIVRLLAEKASGEPLTFASELYPLPPGELVRTSWLFLSAWLGGGVGVVAYALRDELARLRREERTLLVTAFAISSAFLLIALFSARRAMVEWVAFGSLGLPLLWPRVRHRLGAVPVRLAAAAIVVLHLAWGGWRHTLNVDLVAFEPDTMEGVATFLEARSNPGEVVFHAKWDNFGPLFARNRTNRYLGGMDPIFQFAHDPRLYWEFFYLSTDASTEWTCDAFPCIAGRATDTHRVLVEHFGARWVVVEPRRNPRLSLYLLNDDRYALALETEREAVFEVLTDVAPRGG